MENPYGAHHTSHKLIISGLYEFSPPPAGKKRIFPPASPVPPRRPNKVVSAKGRVAWLCTRIALYTPTESSKFLFAYKTTHPSS
eukprot:scaffold8282_cov142-Isochrysis_galbana.AAC.2